MNDRDVFVVSPEDRDRLAAMQAIFLQALTGSGAVPEGFDASRIEALGESLASKRMRSMGRAWPALAASLGAEFAIRFAAFAVMNPLPGQGGPLADGRAFARSLTSRGGVSPGLSDDALLEIMAVDLRYRSAGREGGLLPRHGFAVRVAILRTTRRGVLAVRLPYFGEHWLSLPLTWRSL